MPNELSKTTTVEYTPEFKRNLRVLAKKYPHIRSDVQPLIEQLQSGNLSGDQVPGVRHTIFKLRVRNSDIQKGKRSGYRLIPFEGLKEDCFGNHLFQTRAERHFH